MTMEVAYVIGPYRSGDNLHGIKKNIDNAEAIALELWGLGFAVICPHKNTAFFDGATENYNIWLEGGIELLKRSDFAVTVKGWENSKGSVNEVNLCKENKIPVFHSIDEVKSRK